MIDLAKTHLTHPWGPPWTLATLLWILDLGSKRVPIWQVGGAGPRGLRRDARGARGARGGVESARPRRRNEKTHFTWPWGPRPGDARFSNADPREG